MNTTTEDAELAAIVLEQAERVFQGEVTEAVRAAADGGQWPAALWEQVGAAGLPLALVPEAQGGAGVGAATGLALLRRAAFHALPLPLGETMLAHALWSQAGGTVRAPQQPATLAASRVALELQRQEAGWRLSGLLESVPFATVSHSVLVCARDPEGRCWLACVPCASLAWTPQRNLANEPRLATRLEGLLLPADAVRAAPAAVAALGLLPHGALLRAHQLVGAMERCLELALAYARERVQFGRTISAFAPVQVMLVEAAGHIAAATAAVEGAAEAWDAQLADPDAFVRNVATAKSRAGEAAGAVAALCHQVHGAMGFTQEHALHHFTRRLWSWRDECGSEAHWNTWLGAAVCSRGGDALWPAITAN
jgi:acyl-CoA dehydrogenase